MNRNRRELVVSMLSLRTLVKRPKGAAHWRYPQTPNLLLQGITTVRAGPYKRSSAGSRCSQKFEEFLHAGHLPRLLTYSLQLPRGKAVGIKFRKDDCSASSAFYFNLPAMWQVGSGSTTTKDLTNTVSTPDGPIHPGCSASLLHNGGCGLQCLSFFPWVAGLVPPTGILRTWGLSTSQRSASDLVHGGLLGLWADLEGAKFPRKRERSQALSLALQQAAFQTQRL